MKKTLLSILICVSLSNIAMANDEHNSRDIYEQESAETANELSMPVLTTETQEILLDTQIGNKRSTERVESGYTDLKQKEGSRLKLSYIGFLPFSYTKNDFYFNSNISFYKLKIGNVQPKKSALLPQILSLDDLTLSSTIKGFKIGGLVEYSPNVDQQRIITPFSRFTFDIKSNRQTYLYLNKYRNNHYLQYNLGATAGINYYLGDETSFSPKIYYIYSNDFKASDEEFNKLKQHQIGVDLAARVNDTHGFTFIPSFRYGYIMRQGSSEKVQYKSDNQISFNLKAVKSFEYKLNLLGKTFSLPNIILDLGYTKYQRSELSGFTYNLNASYYF